MASVLLVLSIALIAALFMSFTVGANSNSAPVAPAVGANALSVLRAALLVGIVAGLGAILQGGSISETIGKDLITGVTITPLAAAAALLTAATLITIGNSYGYPIPSAFTVTGAMIGAGIALGGGFAYHEYVVILGFWFAIPVVEGVLAYGLARGLRSESVPETVGIPLLGGAVGYALANIQLTIIPTASGSQGSAARYIATQSQLLPMTIGGTYTLGMVLVSVIGGLVALLVTRALLQRDETAGINQFLIALGLIVVFTSGGTQVGLATGPLETIFESELRLPSIYLLALGGGGILLGAWIRGPRLVQAVSNEYASLGPRRSIAALIPAFLIAQLAIVFGIPISFNKVMIASIVGSGLAAESSSGNGVSPRKVGYTVGSWVGSMFGAGLISYTLYHLLNALLGIG
ncbi:MULTISPECIES: inorganic phosphate transporter [unclassified Halobacterium]|uniref:inorganic phosphate transporter n=1 Tax=unclassified Halobacterium TaxID=2668073 RepID=UPI001E380CE9|nr:MULTISPECIES: inorganic phosphate transporter [unclassified Halobacterium]MCD2200728.1 inorganic phosphate transporter [Halobacterium sp. KA-4]MCD2203996.1 inorganic phosphate transporter [Halobacterium sp. KA-6]